MYIGGACCLIHLVPKGLDALSPENVLIFAVSAVVGAPISGNARHCVRAKSPQTGGIARSEGQ
jgi:aldehyde:ferredoxin oxidoreductase